MALYLKKEISKAERSKKLPDHLDYLLDPQRPITDSDNIDSCKWIIAGGLTYEDFGKKGKFLKMFLLQRNVIMTNTHTVLLL